MPDTAARWSLAPLFAAVCLLALGCGRAGFGDDVQAEQALEISRVVVEAQRVQPGQQQVEVHLHLRNRTTAPLTALTAPPRFVRGQQDLADYFEIEAAADNATEIPRAEGVVLVYWVAVWGDLLAGPLTVDGFAVARTGDGAEARAERALETAALEVVVPDAIEVTVADDEDDTGGDASVAAAGGLMDISLREALLIANAAGEPRLIRFDPAVFPPAAPTAIALDPALGLLPSVTNPMTTIDGTDAGVVIDGGAIIDGSGLRVAADDFTLRAVAMRGFNGGELYRCLESYHVDRVQILGCTFEACGLNEGNGSQVTLLGGQDHLVADSIFRAGKRDGLHLEEQASYAQVLRNRFEGNTDDGIEVMGDGHLVAENLMQGNSGNGAENAGMSNVVFRDNDFLDNGEHGFELQSGSRDVLIQRCSFARNSRNGIDIASGNIWITVSASAFEANGGLPISIVASANEGLAPPEITDFDGMRAAGSAAAEGGSVEVYAYASAYTYLGSAPVSGGLWSLALDAPAVAVVATVTSSGGSTSAFSDFFLDGSTDLVVTTTDDELDGGDQIMTTTQAGGAGDLSLREAIVLANAWLGPDRITFSPSVFPPGAETAITLRPPPAGLGPLPAITDDGTAIDGSGAGVLIDGGTAPYGEYSGALSFLAHDVRCATSPSAATARATAAASSSTTATI